MRCICCLSDNILLRLFDRQKYFCCSTCGFVFKSKEEIQYNRNLIEKHYQGSDPHERVAESKQSFFNYALSYLSEHVAQDKNILDVGCGYGYFLKMAADRAWNVKGVEITGDAAKRSKELLGEQHIFHGSISEANFPDNFFGAVTLWDILAYVDDPFEDLKECYRIMKRAGTVGIRVRNVFFQKTMYQVYSPLKTLASRFKIKKPYVFNHYCFSADSIYRLLRRAGFAKIRIANSPLTEGDPYGHTNLMGAIHLAKRFISLFSESILKLSSGKRIVGPSLLIWAEKY